MVTLFLSGDVMTGRGIDQILPHPCAPQLFEEYIRSSVEYVRLAEEAHGPIARPVDFGYVWGDALAELERARPDARIVNLETAVTTAAEPWPDKGVHYRMHPSNTPCLGAARIDCCVLANNHVLDWGYGGMAETLRTLHRAAIRTAGAGSDAAQAAAPAPIPSGDGSRILVFAFCTPDSGVPPQWAASRKKSGVNLLDDLSPARVEAIERLIDAHRRPGDVVVASLHWGGNWGYTIEAEQRGFAHRLIDQAHVDVVYGHSSHHPKGIELYRDKLILYGCGDLLNDYEGIGGRETFRPDLALMYLPALDPSTGRVLDLQLVPMQVHRLQLRRASKPDTHWLLAMLNRESSALGAAFAIDAHGWLGLTDRNAKARAPGPLARSSEQ